MYLIQHLLVLQNDLLPTSRDFINPLLTFCIICDNAKAKKKKKN